TSLTARYKIHPIATTWSAADNGTNEITLHPDQVRDSFGAAAAEKVLGTLQVTIADSHVIFVDSTADGRLDHVNAKGQPVDKDGQVTLRAAIQQINALEAPTTAGGQLTYSSFLGGSGDDQAN